MARKDSEDQKKSMSVLFRGRAIFKPLNTGRIDEHVSCVREWVANIFFYTKNGTTIMIDAGINDTPALSRLLAGKTVLVIAHRMRTVEAADKIIVLADGKVAEEGTPEELLKKENGIFRRMTQLQSASAGWSI